MSEILKLLAYRIKHISLYCAMLKSKLITILIFFSICQLAFTQSIFKGLVIDESNNPISYASILIKENSTGILTNELGEFEISVNLSKPKTLIVQSVGYKLNEYKLNNASPNILKIVLSKDEAQIQLVDIIAGEDPSVPIIKKVISNKPIYLKAQKPYTAELYSKGLVKFLDAPKKILGRELGDLGGALDSNRQGIIYLSESVSELYFEPPSKTTERLLSSIVSGDKNAISSNQFNFSNFDFYKESIYIQRGLISPLANDALDHYDTFLYDEYLENGVNIAKIKVRPKNLYTPCFSGFIYINKDRNILFSTDLIVTAKQMKSGLIDSVRIRQIFVPTAEDKKDWVVLTQTISFGVNIFGIISKGNFSYVFKDFNYDKKIELKKGEIFSASSNVIKNDTAYWNTRRAIPLTIEESTDYTRKDSIEIATNTPAYLDSIDRRNNKFKLMDILFGYDASNSIKRHYYKVGAPLQFINFNAVEGINVNVFGNFSTRDKNFNTIHRIDADIKYGFLDQKFKYDLSYQNNYNRKNLSRFRIALGHNYFQYFQRGVVSPLSNSYLSLINKDNRAIFFNKNYIEAQWSSEISNGIFFTISTQLAQRNDLNNSTNYSFYKKDINYKNNNPFNEADEDFNFNDKTLENTFSIRWNPGQKYKSYDSEKDRIRSNWPSLTTTLTYAPQIKQSFTNFSKIELAVTDRFLALRRGGFLAYNIYGGSFLSNKKSNVIDHFHQGQFNGFYSNYIQAFKFVRDYKFTSPKPFGAVFFEYHPDGFFNDKIPILKKTPITGIYSFAAFKNTDRSYIEPSVGIEGIRIGPLDICRIDYVWSIENGKVLDHGFKIGFSRFFEGLINR
jgi:hypothetical protein